MFFDFPDGTLKVCAMQDAICKFVGGAFLIESPSTNNQQPNIKDECKM
ncbi:hypothetical protein ACVWYG_000749 [Pedobacter sp. UYEF25]